VQLHLCARAQLIKPRPKTATQASTSPSEANMHNALFARIEIRLFQVTRMLPRLAFNQPPLARSVCASNANTIREAKDRAYEGPNRVSMLSRITAFNQPFLARSVCASNANTIREAKDRIYEGPRNPIQPDSNRSLLNNHSLHDQYARQMPTQSGRQKTEFM
jgi:hypothetical protein